MRIYWSLVKRRYSKQYALWKKITNDFAIGDIVKTKRDGGISYPRGARFIVLAIQTDKVIAMRYGYPYMIPKNHLKVIGYVEGFKQS